MYEIPPTDEELAAVGLVRDDLDAVEIWPENWESYLLFSFMGTQWRVGMSGYTGLDYNVLFHKMDRMQLSPEDFESMESDMRVMETAALEEFGRQRSK